VNDGLKYVFICGTTGEGVSLTKDERKNIANVWSQTTKTLGLQLIVHVGAESVADAVELAAHAEALGVYAIASIPPVFFKPATIPNLVSTMVSQQRAIAAGAPRTPFYYYHFPALTGSLLSGVDAFHTQAAAAIPTYYGLKFTDYDLFLASKCERYRDVSGNGFQVLFGKDEVMDAALLQGITGFVGSTYNFAAKLYNGIISSWQQRNITAVQEGQLRAQLMVQTFLSFSADGVNAQKAIPMLKNKLDLGPPRLPQMPLSPSAQTAMDAQLRAIGFYQWA